MKEKQWLLRELAKLDEARCATVLIPLLDALPPNGNDADMRRPDWGLSQIVVRLNRRDVGRAFLAAARRASVGMRMSMLYSIDSSRPPYRPVSIALLSAFLDDETLRDSEVAQDQFQDALWAEEFPCITVRDFVANRLVGLLDIGADPDPSWTPEQWSALREQVRERLAQEELPVLE